MTDIFKTGSVYALSSSDGEFKLLVLVEVIKKDVISIALPSTPYKRLKVLQNGKVIFEEGENKHNIEKRRDLTSDTRIFNILCHNVINLSPYVGGKFSHFAVEAAPIDGSIDSSVLGHVAFKAIAQAHSVYLCPDDANSRHLSVTDTRCDFAVVEVAVDPLCDSALTIISRPTLSPHQMEAFMRDGYIQIRDVVPMHLVNKALRCINNAIGSGSNFVPQAMHSSGTKSVRTEMAGFKLAGGVSNDESIKDLFYGSNVVHFAESIIGRSSIQPVAGAQLALIFPEPLDARGSTAADRYTWHTDGMRQGHSCPFSLLCGISLSNVTETQSGNFTVYPQSHHLLHTLLQKDGRLPGDEYDYEGKVLPKDLPYVGEPCELLASRGDLVFAHPKLAHNGGLNFSPDIRYQVYFRLKHRNHSLLKDRELHEDIFADLDGVRHYRDGRGGA